MARIALLTSLGPIARSVTKQAGEWTENDFWVKVRDCTD
jgi:hypothetical protein